MSSSRLSLALATMAMLLVSCGHAGPDESTAANALGGSFGSVGVAAGSGGQATSAGSGVGGASGTSAGGPESAAVAGTAGATVASAGGVAGAGGDGHGGAPTAAIGAGGAPTAGSDNGGMSAVRVEQWHPIELTLGGTSASQLTDRLSVTFTGPGAETLVIPGFYDGPAGWKVRFAPTALGAWSYDTSSSIPAVHGRSGRVQCIANTNPRIHGRLVIDAAHPHHFKYEDGTPYVLMAFEADWLGLLDFGDAAIPRAKSLIDLYAGHGFNQVMMNVFARDTAWKAGKTSSEDFGPPTQNPWQGSPTKPDYSHMNPDFFVNFDRVMGYLFEQGVIAHVMIKVNNKDVQWPAKGSAEDDLYFNHLLARYQAYPNLLWDFGKESNYEIDAAYKSDRIRLIRRADAYRHPVSTHTDLGYYASAVSSSLLDFRTDQNQDNWYSTIVSHESASAWPVFNSEYDYEIGNDGGKTYGHASDKLTCFKRACEVTMAGAGFAYYYTYHAWDVVRVSEVPGGLGYYKNLFRVISGTKWQDLSRADELLTNAGEGRHCLAKAGTEYLVYLAGAGTASLEIKQVTGTVHGKWLNLISGQEQSIAELGNGRASLTNPWTEPAMAHLGK